MKYWIPQAQTAEASVDSNGGQTGIVAFTACYDNSRR